MFAYIDRDYREDKDGYVLREMGEQDFDEVVGLEESIFSEAWMRADFETALSNKDQLFLVVEKEGHVVGYSCMWVIVDAGEIMNIAVSETERRKGLASRMIEALQHFGGLAGAESYMLEVREHNESAIALYEKHGFKVVGRRKNYYNHPREDAILMTAGKLSDRERSF